MTTPSTPHHVRLGAQLGVAVLLLASCQTAYYATMEQLGYHKRDLLVRRIQEARDSQEEANAEADAFIKAQGQG